METERNELHPPRKRRPIVWLLMILFSIAVTPFACSFVECPSMPYYTAFFPIKTSMMQYRQHEAKKKKKTFKLRYETVPLEKISPSLRKAAVAAEDGHFYEHHGFDFEALRKAYEYNKKKGRTIRGGSTISQQVAKNLWLSPKRSWYRKVVEAVLTVRLELAMSKDRILEIYLNTIEWGDGIFGAEAAARHYFNTSAAKLTPYQSALLAAAIPSPLRSNPANPSGYLQRRARLIMRGFAPPPEEEQNEEPAPTPQPTPVGKAEETPQPVFEFQADPDAKGAPAP